jgi:hypothetical protein
MHPGPTPKLTDRDLRRLFSEASSKAGATSTSIKLAAGVYVTARRIRQILHDTKKFKYMKRKNAPMLKQKHVINILKLPEKNMLFAEGLSSVMKKVQS